MVDDLKFYLNEMVKITDQNQQTARWNIYLWCNFGKKKYIYAHIRADKSLEEYLYCRSMLVNHLDGGQPWFIALVDYHEVNSPTMAISPMVINTIPMWHYWTHNWKKMCTTGSGNSRIWVHHTPSYALKC